VHPLRVYAYPALQERTLRRKVHPLQLNARIAHQVNIAVRMEQLQNRLVWHAQRELRHLRMAPPQATPALPAPVAVSLWLDRRFVRSVMPARVPHPITRPAYRAMLAHHV
jgi:hypothetical protein